MGMFLPAGQNQILKAVVVLDPVLVVDQLVAIQISPEITFQNQTVFKDKSAIGMGMVRSVCHHVSVAADSPSTFPSRIFRTESVVAHRKSLSGTHQPGQVREPPALLVAPDDLGDLLAVADQDQELLRPRYRGVEEIALR